MGVIRRTKSVNTILEIFEKSSGAISVVELIDQLSDKMNKTTIYRILDRLDEDAVLHSFLGNDGVKWYAKCNNCSAHHHMDLHPHFQCKECGKTDCVEVDIPIPSISNRTIESSQVLFVGLCEECTVA
ncbi:MAG: Fur family transcriptional regulator [Crocinitomicaceae bacterium]